MRRRPALALGLALAVLAWPTAGPARAAAYNRFYANFDGQELMRVINADRQALGLPPLATDATLESIARDRAVTCPSNSSLIVRGRARDMADRTYLSHAVKGCLDAAGGSFDAFDLLRRAGYSFGRAAEDISDNNYPSSPVAYDLGCSTNGTSCRGSTILPWTVAVAERAYMSSSLHRANLLSTVYRRFGCAAWASSTGYHYFACYFADSGSGVLDATAPWVTGMSGVGGHFAVGSTPVFTATAVDGASLLSDGWAAIDGRRIRSWAWDHAGTRAALSARAPALTAGRHTFTWWLRDASTRHRAVSFTFYVP